MTLRTVNLSFSYGGDRILREVSIEAGPGVTALLGPNGAGKSTLVKCLSGVIRPDGGTAEFNGIDLLDARRGSLRMGYLAQDLPAVSETNVLEMMLLGRINSLGLEVSVEDLDKAYGALEDAGIEDLAARDFNELSGGQRQMVMAAQCLVDDPDLIILDEPTNNLDIRRELDLFEMMTRYTEEHGITTLMVLHDVNFASRFAGNVVVMRDGKVYSTGTPEEVITEGMLRDVYGVEAKVGRDVFGNPHVEVLHSIRLRSHSAVQTRSEVYVMSENKEKRQGRFSKLAGYAGGHRYLTYAAMILSGLSAAISVVPFYYIWKMIEEVLRVMPDYDRAAGLANDGWMALGFTALGVLVYIAALMCSHVAAFRVAKNIRKTCIEHVIELPPGAFDMMGSGKVRRTIQDSASATETYLAHQLPDMAGSVVLPLAILVMLFLFDWRLGIASLVPVVLAFLVMWSMVGSKVMKEHMAAYQGALGDVNKEAVEYVRGISVVKAFQQTVESFQAFKESILRYSEFVIKYTRWCSGRMCLFVVASNLAFASIVIMALAIDGSLDWTPEFLSDFLFYVIFTPLVGVLLMRIMFASNEGYIVDDALSRVDDLMAIRQLPEPDDPKIPSDSTLRFENVTFTYPGADRPAVDSFSLTMSSGTVTALVGPSGSGKSTVANLACRFWDPQSGRVTVGGVDLREIGGAKLGEMISFVFQSSHLIKGTLAENVRIARPDASVEEVLAALHMAQCDDILAKLPEGLETNIGPRGVYLSGGEVQRVAIARAILKDSPIVILDEATAFADPENEYLVQRAFENLSKDRTVLLIAHRLTTVRDADQICVMGDGRIVEVGTHPELLESRRVYSRMWSDYQQALSWKVQGAVQ